MTQQFDPNLPLLIEGEITTVAVIDPAPPGNSVIDPALPFDVTITWRVFGLLVPDYIGTAAQNWTVSVYGETIGPGVDLVLANVLQDKNDFTGPLDNRTYSRRVTVPATTLQEHDQNNSGIYRIAVAVFLRNTVTGRDLIGFSEGSVIQAERP